MADSPSKLTFRNSYPAIFLCVVLDETPDFLVMFRMRHERMNLSKNRGQLVIFIYKSIQAYNGNDQMTIASKSQDLNKFSHCKRMWTTFERMIFIDLMLSGVNDACRTDSQMNERLNLHSSATYMYMIEMS